MVHLDVCNISFAESLKYKITGKQDLYEIEISYHSDISYEQFQINLEFLLLLKDTLKQT